MPCSDLLIPFFISSLVFASVPGPGMLYMAAQTLASGRRAGWYAALGFHVASFVHIAAAAFGLSILLQAVPALFTVMKLVGAAYLIWLGIRCLTGAARLPTQIERPEKRSPCKALKDSMIVEILNPKSVLFYFTFLPQFTEPAASLPVWAQVLILGAIVNCIFTATDAVLIGLSAAARRLCASRQAQRSIKRACGAVLVALGLNLALARQ